MSSDKKSKHPQPAASRLTLSRRAVLKGIGGTAIALPFLESLAGRRVAAADDAVEPFAIFFRQASGVAQSWGDEPERFWPRQMGALTPESLEGRALDELVDHRQHLLVVQNVNLAGFAYNDGHANGAVQALTAVGPYPGTSGGNSMANGESLDHRIGRELNPGGRDSLFMYAGRHGGWLGGSCISYRGPGNKRAALRDPWNAYQSIVGGDGGMSEEAQVELVERRRSVNDLVRGQMQQLLSRSDLSADDRRRLDLHFSSIRDLEVALSCRLSDDAARMLEGASPGFDSVEGDEVLETARLHMDVAVLAIACGYTRSAAIQVGAGNDGFTRYRNLDTGELMDNNFHYISHRRESHGASGPQIADADLLHHYVDRQFAQTFRYLLERLDAYVMPDGNSLLSHGVSVWYNDNANGPPHGRWNVPWILAGSAGGFLKQGEMVALGDRRDPNHSQLLNTIGAAAGLTNDAGEPLDDFGDPELPQGLRSELLA
jgi:hypothetical protein